MAMIHSTVASICGESTIVLMHWQYCGIASLANTISTGPGRSRSPKVTCH